MQKKLSQGWRVVSCYEAGPFGYVLHGQLTALGVTNYVVRPRNWNAALALRLGFPLRGPLG